ncbi:RNA methyltransferase [Metabacillus sp. GX 13764]|uniref:TRM11 family SAM-dependent methyltransferase n=1 Tax=Metabacillus kandeliae TaxID=2900151 RepID=UPI001E522598|nr:RNA methyltransferase [Metabacillus kandeliae]MCD7033612.1 RNA methyltransferase [Metabacillus kandeliae]
MKQTNKFVYTYTYSLEEQSLCMLEMRTFFNDGIKESFVVSEIEVNPDRSPFLRERIDVLFEGKTIQELEDAVTNIDHPEQTFKIICSKHSELPFSYQDRRSIERKLGAVIKSEADMHHPDIYYGVFAAEDNWYFGRYQKSEAVWLKHIKKPQQYSTALSTRVARSIVNIAIPDPEGVRAIDPCCGIGNVLVEALSMGIRMEGRDINHLAAKGARENIAYFGLEGSVTSGPISEAEGYYDAAIIDLPYNLYTHITEDEQFDIIKHARRISKRAVIVSVAEIEDKIAQTGFSIKDRGLAVKSQFSRHIYVCE